MAFKLPRSPDPAVLASTAWSGSGSWKFSPGFNQEITLGADLVVKLVATGV